MLFDCQNVIQLIYVCAKLIRKFSPYLILRHLHKLEYETP
jgi:hypothetical protein